MKNGVSNAWTLFWLTTTNCGCQNFCNRFRQVMIITMVLIPCVGFSQKNTYKGFPSLVWPKLYDIEFHKAKDKLGEYDKPIFSTGAKSLNGKAVTLPGYMVPFDNGVKGSRFMLSSMPLNACFFCGVGGPESVVEIYTKNIVSFTEKPIEVRGVLKLNDSDPDKMMYVLEQAEILGEIEF
ncbi:MAG: hypothetical protein JNM57_17100 [Cyclobacteriaceae bacterium]|nr:hypothetical protein [Cyclobacteriaceae bacterium]